MNASGRLRGWALRPTFVLVVLLLFGLAMASLALAGAPVARQQDTRIGSCYQGIWQGQTSHSLNFGVVPGQTWAGFAGGGSASLKIDARRNATLSLTETFTGTQTVFMPFGDLGPPEETYDVTFVERWALDGPLEVDSTASALTPARVTLTLNGDLLQTETGSFGSNAPHSGPTKKTFEGTLLCAAHKLVVSQPVFGTIAFTNNLSVGQEFEAQVLLDKGIVKNGPNDPCGPKGTTYMVATVNGVFIPDALSPNCMQIDEIKCVARLNNSNQFRAFASVGVPVNLYLCPKNVSVSKPLRTLIEKSGGKITVRLPNGRYRIANFDPKHPSRRV
jgi:hypothetical protein